MASSVPEVPAMDEFAQTRGADDLFDDEIVPVSAEEEAQQSHSDPEVSQPVDKPGIDTQSAPNDTAQPRGDGRSKAKSRGRPVSQRGGRADRDAGNKTAENYEQFKVIEYNDNCPPVPKPQDDTKLAKSTSNEAANQRVPAVRGDRSATGGVRKVRARY